MAIKPCTENDLYYVKYTIHTYKTEIIGRKIHQNIKSTYLWEIELRAIGDLSPTQVDFFFFQY